MADGNFAAMREALEGVVKYLGEIIPTRREIKLVKSARAALSAPPRNCDRYRTADEAREAHANSDDWLMAFGDWLFAPAKERKGETDGSKSHGCHARGTGAMPQRVDGGTRPNR